MKHKARYKVLPLPDFVENYEWQYGVDGWLSQMISEGYQQLNPVFHRNGWYYDRLTKTAWYEYKDVAFMFGRDGRNGDAEQFLYVLGQYETKHLNQAEVDAIETLMVYGICPQELGELFYRHRDNMVTRGILRGRFGHRFSGK